MTLEIIDTRDGYTKMTTASPECHYPLTTLLAMEGHGYRFRYGGKWVKAKALANWHGAEDAQLTVLDI